MDQSAFSGIGNIYSDEILFQCGIHPDRKMTGMDEGSLRKLFGCMRSTLKEAIDARADPEKMPGHFLTPHRSPDAQCPKCNGRVRKAKIAGRSSYFCPACQKK